MASRNSSLLKRDTSGSSSRGQLRSKKEVESFRETILIESVPDSKSLKAVPKSRHRTWYRLKKRRKRLRKWIVIGLAGLLPAAGLLGYEGYKFSLKWKERRVVAQAKTFLEQGDFSRALPRLLKALELNPDNLEAGKLSTSNKVE